MKNCGKACFPLETAMTKEEATNAATSEGDRPVVKQQLQDSPLTPATTPGLASQMTITEKEEKSCDYEDSRL